MARPVDISDEAIIDIAQELFFEQGIAATEMKDIAQRAGIGRSSLYRHFESKESIAFSIAARILTQLTAVLETPGPQAETGAQALLEILKRYVQKLVENPAWVRFLDEFDQFFSDVYPESKAALDYISFNRQLSNGMVDAALERGAQDGSLHLHGSSKFMGRFLLNTLLALAQRILPRAQHYDQEQGYSLEYLTLLPQVLADGLSGK
ncbi:TetR/AcrR family transcriptional regulator [Allofournierella sp.]|uniref:TetR/AcrR family transcriptional regulator n=1 Tax=Allofournierella sp. TaxID=1940256 RepID=UPI003AB3FC17